MSEMIEISALSKAFGPIEVLRSVDLTVRRGRVLAIVGPNGAGKTRLVRSHLLAGVQVAFDHHAGHAGAQGELLVHNYRTLQQKS